MLLPSRELLSEVWGSEVTSIENVCTMWDMQVLPFWVKEKRRVNCYDDKKYHIAIETMGATYMNNDITFVPMMRILKKIGYVSKYVLTEHGFRQRLVKDE